MKYVKNCLISLGVGALAGFLNRVPISAFSELTQPPLTPPSWLFSVVWTILYILMGIGITRIQEAPAGLTKTRAIRIYYLQLLLNFCWPFLFFGFGLYSAAFVLLLALLVLVIEMTDRFYHEDELAGFLQIPYVLWLTFAGYLNLGFAILNR